MDYNISSENSIEFSAEDLGQLFRQAANFIDEYFEYDPLWINPVINDCTDEDGKYYLKLYFSGGVGHSN